MKNSHSRRGFTLMELLIVISIIGLVATVGFLTNWKAQVDKGHDATRKDDLRDLQIALEHYTNDHGCYPTELEMSDCTSNIFEGYNMRRLECDPVFKTPYYYELVDSTDSCLGYYLYTTLKNPADPDIERLGCDDSNGCYQAGGATYNYGVSSGPSVNRN